MKDKLKKFINIFKNNGDVKEIEQFSGINMIDVSGDCQLQLNEDGKLFTTDGKKVKFKKKGKTLTIYSGNSSSVSISGNGNISVINNNVYINGVLQKTHQGDDQEGEKEFLLINPKINNIDLSGQSSIKVMKSNLLDKNITLDTSGQSQILIEGNSENKNKLNIDTSGQSTINVNNMNIGSVNADSSGQSTIDLRTCTIGSITKDSSGQSKIKT